MQNMMVHIFRRTMLPIHLEVGAPEAEVEALSIQLPEVVIIEDVVIISHDTYKQYSLVFHKLSPFYYFC